MRRKKIEEYGVKEPLTLYESQVTEWKEIWRDEYLKWICGFANAQGGKLIIGKNDKGVCVGLKDANKLLVDIPNKIRDILGIVADVNLKQEAGREYLEIAVEPYPSPVNYRGEYHYRTGSTKQELKGHALDSFLLKKYGLHWDGVSDPHLGITTFDDQIFRMFVKKGLKSGRLNPSSHDDTKEHLLAKVIIWNSATISNELPIERLLGKHPSIPPNPLLAAAFFRAGYIESWGRGIDKMRIECKMANTKAPEIKYDFGGVMVTFTGEIPVASESSQPAHTESTPKTPESSVKTPESSVKTPESSVKSPESSVKIIALINENKQVTIPVMAEKLHLTTRAIEKQLRKLQDDAVIRRIGPAKGGHWEVIEKI